MSMKKCTVGWGEKKKEKVTKGNMRGEEVKKKNEIWEVRYGIES